MEIASHLKFNGSNTPNTSHPTQDDTREALGALADYFEDGCYGHAVVILAVGTDLRRVNRSIEILDGVMDLTSISKSL